MKKGKEKSIHTNIFHPFREMLRLSVMEYVILDDIRQMSTFNPSKPYCFKTPTSIGIDYGVCEKTVRRYQEKLLAFGYIEKNKDGKYKTAQWFNDMLMNRDAYVTAYRSGDISFFAGNPKLLKHLGQNDQPLGQNDHDRPGQNDQQDIHIIDKHIDKKIIPKGITKDSLNLSLEDRNNEVIIKEKYLNSENRNSTKTITTGTPPDAPDSTESDLNNKNDITLDSGTKTQHRANTGQELELLKDLFIYAEKSGVELDVSSVAWGDFLDNYDKAEIIKYGKTAIDWTIENPKKSKGSILRTTRFRKFLESAKKKSPNKYW